MGNYNSSQQSQDEFSSHDKKEEKTYVYYGGTVHEKDRDNIVHVIIASSVTRIEKGAFRYCQRLKTVQWTCRNSSQTTAATMDGDELFSSPQEIVASSQAPYRRPESSVSWPTEKQRRRFGADKVPSPTPSHGKGLPSKLLVRVVVP